MAIALWLVTAATGCIQVLGDDYTLQCADETDCEECFGCTNQGPCAELSARCDGACIAYGSCTVEEGCDGSSCDDDCNAAHPGGQALWDALFECGYELCEEACDP